MNKRILGIIALLASLAAAPACSAILGFNPKPGDAPEEEILGDASDLEQGDGTEADPGRDPDADFIGEADGPPPDAADLDAESDGETPAWCDGDEDCPDDLNMCNGEEYCDNSGEVCSRRGVPDDGTVCGTDLVCLDELCIPITCGDGDVDPLEECDDGRDEDPYNGCKDDCTYTCHNDAECSDSETCNGEEHCLMAVDHTCRAGNPAADMTSCATAGVCCGGVCWADGNCCGNPTCDDAEPCNGAEYCDGAKHCRAGTSSPDMSSCSGGICCSGTCRSGGNCCEHSDCPGDCTGDAMACSSFSDSGSCTGQNGCSLNTSGSCSGDSGNCTYTNLTLCVDCGCELIEYTTCDGTPPLCSAYAFDRCGSCGAACFWVPMGDFCLGDAKACSDMGPGCASQSGCSLVQICTGNICQ